MCRRRRARHRNQCPPLRSFPNRRQLPPPARRRYSRAWTASIVRPPRLLLQSRAPIKRPLPTRRHPHRFRRRSRGRKRSALSRYTRISRTRPGPRRVSRRASLHGLQLNSKSLNRLMRMRRSRLCPRRTMRRRLQRDPRVLLRRRARRRSANRLQPKLLPQHLPHPAEATRFRFCHNTTKRKCSHPSARCKPNIPSCSAGVSRSCAALIWVQRASITAPWWVPSSPRNRLMNCVQA